MFHNSWGSWRITWYGIFFITAIKRPPTMPTAAFIELPVLNPTTVLLLQHNEVDRALPALLREAAQFYHFKYPNMRDTSYYQAIGAKLVKKYPCLVHDGTKPWVSKTKVIHS